MEDLLVPIRTKNESSVKEDVLEISEQPPAAKRGEIPVSDVEDALDALRSKPDLKLLSKTLRWLNPSKGEHGSFDIQQPSSKAAQIIFVLVNDIVPDYWYTLNDEITSSHSTIKALLILCLRSIAGIGAIVSRLRLLLDQTKTTHKQAATPSISNTQPLDDLLNVLEAVVGGDDFFTARWKSILANVRSSSPKFLQWKELLALAASGKLLAIASEASEASNENHLSLKKRNWIGDGSLYATWVGDNIRCMSTIALEDVNESCKALSQLVSRAMSLGYRGTFIGEITRS